MRSSYLKNVLNIARNVNQEEIRSIRWARYQGSINCVWRSGNTTAKPLWILKSNMSYVILNIEFHFDIVYQWHINLMKSEYYLNAK